MFFNAKSDEIVNIFSESFSMEKGQVFNLLTEIDPTNTDKYNVLKASN
jgi:hypothetical protein